MNEIQLVKVNFGFDHEKCIKNCDTYYPDSLLKSKYVVIGGNIQTDQLINASLDLNQYSSYEDYFQICKSKYKGAVIRQAKKSDKMGFICKRFNQKLFVPDIVEINHSKEVRSGGTMKSSYRRSVEEMGGYPKTYMQFSLPQCPIHYNMSWGIFQSVPGRLLGDVLVDEKLLGYINFKRIGDLAVYSKILGHGDYLNYGIMYKLHFSILEWIFSRENEYTNGIEHILYATWNSGGQDSGLQQWKKKTLFHPAYWITEEPHQFSDSQFESTMESAEKLENTHNRQALPSGPYPVEILPSCENSLFLFTGMSDGKYDLIYADQAELKNVSLNVINEDYLEKIKIQYSSEWEYFNDNAFHLINKYVEQDKFFDLVNCNCSSNLVSKFFDKYFPKLYKICRKYLVITITGEYLENNATLTQNKDIAELIYQKHNINVDVTNIIQRSNNYNGCYWLIIKKSIVDNENNNNDNNKIQTTVNSNFNNVISLNNLICVIKNDDHTNYISDILNKIKLKSVLMKDIKNTSNAFLSIRHDVDHSLSNAINMAFIENKFGYKATYFLLTPGSYQDTENYYGSIINNTIVHQKDLIDKCQILLELGHEIGIHNDFVCLSLLLKESPKTLLERELDFFSKHGIEIKGTASHGNPLARKLDFVNYEIFSDCSRVNKGYGRPIIFDDYSVQLNSIKMSDYNLEYEAYSLPKDYYVSDSGSCWSISSCSPSKVLLKQQRDGSQITKENLSDCLSQVSSLGKQVQVLVHPCWWSGVINSFLKKFI
jgi:hypothetical protein